MLMPEHMSLSARRAWIEIFYYADKDCDWVVALRKESVDRNIRRMPLIRFSRVALRKESVDRNDVIRPAIDVFLASLSARRAWIEIIQKIAHLCLKPRRSPQGERG